MIEIRMANHPRMWIARIVPSAKGRRRARAELKKKAKRTTA